MPARASSSLGSLIDEQGTCTNDQIIIADNNETAVRHAFCPSMDCHEAGRRRRLTQPNIGSPNYDVDLNDTENCLHSKDIESMPVEKGFAKILR